MSSSPCVREPASGTVSDLCVRLFWLTVGLGTAKKKKVIKKTMPKFTFRLDNCLALSQGKTPKGGSHGGKSCLMLTFSDKGTLMMCSAKPDMLQTWLSLLHNHWTNDPEPIDAVDVPKEGPALVRFNFQAESALQLSVSRGEAVTVEKSDAGSAQGMVKVVNSKGESGQVPKAYLTGIPPDEVFYDAFDPTTFESGKQQNSDAAEAESAANKQRSPPAVRKDVATGSKTALATAMSAAPLPAPNAKGPSEAAPSATIEPVSTLVREFSLNKHFHRVHGQDQAYAAEPGATDPLEAKAANADGDIWGTWQLNRDRIELQSKIGTGEYGEVWGGVMKGTGEYAGLVANVAVKNLKTEAAADDFRKEAKAMMALRHPNLVSAHYARAHMTCNSLLISVHDCSCRSTYMELLPRARRSCWFRSFAKRWILIVHFLDLSTC